MILLHFTALFFLSNSSYMYNVPYKLKILALFH